MNEPYQHNIDSARKVARNMLNFINEDTEELEPINFNSNEKIILKFRRLDDTYDESDSEYFEGKLINPSLYNKETVIHPELEPEDLDGLRTITNIDDLFFENLEFKLKSIK